MRYEPEVWLAWTPLVVAALHMCEEFVFPGGFIAWDKDYRPDIRKSVNIRFLVIINGLLLVLCYDAGALRSSSWGIPVWLIATGLLFANAIWHVVGLFKTRKYSPGVVTGIALYIPLTIYGFVQYTYFQQYPIALACLWLAIGASYQFWANVIHKIRPGGFIEGFHEESGH